ncbi:hypothetical protein EJ04DRAFT_138731 [Polyplosphaeria fusca]|uniref:Uncharacterized protein n=1 Tax=Polyplosphaeria fusca TaxID=682080 RepID=A0A9P4R2H5_9PLEO|nr:hypothetical protein EJ04DRAFT_138731 [Polyplosphaeria fusca]
MAREMIAWALAVGFINIECSPRIDLIRPEVGGRVRQVNYTTAGQTQVLFESTGNTQPRTINRRGPRLAPPLQRDCEINRSATSRIGVLRHPSCDDKALQFKRAKHIDAPSHHSLQRGTSFRRHATGAPPIFTAFGAF